MLLRSNLWCSYYRGVCKEKLDCILFGLSTLVRLVQPCSMYSLTSPYGHLSIFCSIFGSVPVVSVSKRFDCILFRPSHVSMLSTAMFYVCWYFILPQ